MSTARIHIVVPARYASTRLPGKPLADILGQPMIVRVLSQASQADCQEVVAAVDDERVKAAVEAAGFSAQMTSPDHPSGSDRVMEVATHRGWQDADIVINVQGDEPLLPPAVIDTLAASFRTDPSVEIATIREPLGDPELIADPNVVKVVCADNGDGLYFSRAPIPFARESSSTPQYYRHVGLYGFRVGTLRRITGYSVGQLEDTEKLEQLRWLENGEKIRVATWQEPLPGGVDTPADLQRVIQALQTTR